VGGPGRRLRQPRRPVTGALPQKGAGAPRALTGVEARPLGGAARATALPEGPRSRWSCSPGSASFGERRWSSAPMPRIHRALLLGLKGTMGESELHVLKARLRGGVLRGLGSPERRVTL
jgi:hypothetical protein